MKFVDDDDDDDVRVQVHSLGIPFDSRGITAGFSWIYRQNQKFIRGNGNAFVGI